MVCGVYAVLATFSCCSPYINKYFDISQYLKHQYCFFFIFVFTILSNGSYQFILFQFDVWFDVSPFRHIDLCIITWILALLSNFSFELEITILFTNGNMSLSILFLPFSQIVDSHSEGQPRVYVPELPPVPGAVRLAAEHFRRRPGAGGTLPQCRASWGRTWRPRRDPHPLHQHYRGGASHRALPYLLHPDAGEPHQRHQRRFGRPCWTWLLSLSLWRLVVSGRPAVPQRLPRVGAHQLSGLPRSTPRQHSGCSPKVFFPIRWRQHGKLAGRWEHPGQRCVFACRGWGIVPWCFCSRVLFWLLRVWPDGHWRSQLHLVSSECHAGCAALGSLSCKHHGQPYNSGEIRPAVL